MRRFPNTNVFLIELISFFVIASNATASSDKNLLSLVPPGAAVVAGISTTSHQDQPGNFLLITHNNWLDIQDFLALIGADSTRIIHQIVVVAVPDNEGRLNEHSLLAAGYFDQARIYRSASDGGGQVTHYRGIPVLSVQPFARERGDLNDVRWLVVLDSDILLFGTIASVHQELDRHLASSKVDPSIIQRLSRLRRDDETWCLLAAPIHSDEIRTVLAKFEPALSRLIENGGAFQFGIHYNGHIEFEYEVTTSSDFDPELIPNALSLSLVDPNAKAPLLSPRSGNAELGYSVRGTVKVTRRRYDEWLAEISTSRQTIGAPK